MAVKSVRTPHYITGFRNGDVNQRIVSQQQQQQQNVAAVAAGKGNNHNVRRRSINNNNNNNNSNSAAGAGAVSTGDVVNMKMSGGNGILSGAVMMGKNGGGGSAAVTADLTDHRLAAQKHSAAFDTNKWEIYLDSGDSGDLVGGGESGSVTVGGRGHVVARHHPHDATTGPWQLSAIALLAAVVLLSALFLHIITDAQKAHHHYSNHSYNNNKGGGGRTGAGGGGGGGAGGGSTAGGGGPPGGGPGIVHGDNSSNPSPAGKTRRKKKTDESDEELDEGGEYVSLDEAIVKPPALTFYHQPAVHPQPGLQHHRHRKGGGGGGANGMAIHQPKGFQQRNYYLNPGGAVVTSYMSPTSSSRVTRTTGGGSPHPNREITSIEQHLALNSATTATATATTPQYSSSTMMISSSAHGSGTVPPRKTSDSSNTSLPPFQPTPPPHLRSTSLNPQVLSNISSFESTFSSTGLSNNTQQQQQPIQPPPPIFQSSASFSSPKQQQPPQQQASSPAPHLLMPMSSSHRRNMNASSHLDIGSGADHIIKEHDDEEDEFNNSSHHSEQQQQQQQQPRLNSRGIDNSGGGRGTPPLRMTPNARVLEFMGTPRINNMKAIVAPSGMSTASTPRHDPIQPLQLNLQNGGSGDKGSSYSMMMPQSSSQQQSQKAAAGGSPSLVALNPRYSEHHHHHHHHCNGNTSNGIQMNHGGQLHYETISGSSSTFQFACPPRDNTTKQQEQQQQQDGQHRYQGPGRETQHEGNIHAKSPGPRRLEDQDDSNEGDEEGHIPFLPTLSAQHAHAGAALGVKPPKSVNLDDLQLYQAMESGNVPHWEARVADETQYLHDQVFPKRNSSPPGLPLPQSGSSSESYGDYASNDPRKSIHHKRDNLIVGSDAASSLQGAISFSNLRLVEVIGGGGFGQVWKAVLRGTPVAVKILTGSAQSKNVPRAVLEEFVAEINLLKGMRHPNICLYMGACLNPPNRAIITELAANGSLWDALRLPLTPPYDACDGVSRAGWPMSLYKPDARHGAPPSMARVQPPIPPRGSWPWDLVKLVACGAARGMAYLHGGKPPVLHRDLKSANILLTESYTAKVCDFGLSRLKANERSMTGNCGTVQWMAPEVLANMSYNEKADVFSFGIICWELLTRQCPYDGMTAIQCALSVLNRNQRPEIPKWCPPSLYALIRSCMNKNPDERPTFEQLLLAFDSMP